jgi:hypothetical protein
MATKSTRRSARATKKAAPAKKGEAEAQELQVEPDLSNNPPFYYANYASTTHTMTEFIVSFCMIAPPFNVNLDEKQVLAPAVVRVAFPPAMLESFITALQSQSRKHKETFESGEIKIGLKKKDGNK